MWGGGFTISFHVDLGMLSLFQLTKAHVQDPRGGNGLYPVGGHALVVARISGVQVLDAEPRTVLRLANDDASWFLHHGGVVLQPSHIGGRVPYHLAVQNGCLALDDGDVVDGLQEIQKVTCQREGHRKVSARVGGKAAWGPLDVRLRQETSIVAHVHARMRMVDS